MRTLGSRRFHRLGRRVLCATAVVAVAATAALADVAVADPGAASPAPAGAANPGRGRPEHDPDTLLVRFRPGGEAKAERLGAEVEGSVDGTGYTVVSTEGRSVEEMQERLEESGAAVEVEPNHIRRAFAVPNDPGYSAWQSSYLQAVGLPEAWDLNPGSDDLTIAILDSGVDFDHPDLAGRLLPGYDVVNRDGNPSDDQGHGTMVAGIAGAMTNNGTGVAGGAWRGKILPVKVLDSDGSATDADIAFGMVWAVDRGADVLNLSLGGPGASSTLQQAVDYATSRGVVVIAAAGNDHTTEAHYPAAARGVIAVGATDNAGNLASFSNYGSWVDMTAPGVNLTSTTLGNGATYGRANGTSFSAPLVAAAALLLRSADPHASSATLSDRLRASALDLGVAGFDSVFGAGLLDAGAALRLTSGLTGASLTGTGPKLGVSSGYWMLGGEGRVDSFGAATYLGDPSQLPGGAADLEPTPTRGGYWIVGRLGDVYAYGNAPYFGAVVASRLRPGELVTSLSATPSGHGYWIFTTAGRVFGFGDAGFVGDMAGATLNGPVLDSIPTTTGKGYFMVASDGGIFAFGDAVYAGSMGGRALNAPVQSLVPDTDGSGYWLVASDGGIFAFDAPFLGSMGGTPLNAPVTGMVAFGNGYLMVGTDGGVFNFSDKPFAGSLGAVPPANPIVAVAVLPS